MTPATASAVLRRCSDKGANALARQFGDALRVADAAGAERVIEEAVRLGVAPAAVQALIVAPAMVRIGELWELGLLTVAEERAATSICEGALLPLRQSMCGKRSRTRSREHVLLAAVAGQHHVHGLRMVGDVLEGAGFMVRNLGADVAVDRLRAFVAEHEPAVVGLAFGIATDVSPLADSLAAIHAVRPQARIMLGGRSVPPALWQAGYPRVASSMDVVSCVEDLIHGPPQTPPEVLALLGSGRTAGSTAPPLSGVASADG